MEKSPPKKKQALDSFLVSIQNSPYEKPKAKDRWNLHMARFRWWRHQKTDSRNYNGIKHNTRTSNPSIWYPQQRILFRNRKRKDYIKCLRNPNFSRQRSHLKKHPMQSIPSRQSPNNSIYSLWNSRNNKQGYIQNYHQKTKCMHHRQLHNPNLRYWRTRHK